MSEQVKKQIFCFNNGGMLGMLHAMALCEDGHCLAEHACSSVGWMPHDLGIVGDWKHEHYNKHCGEGNWELVWVDDPKTHEGVQTAYQLNQALGRAAEEGGTG